MSDTKDLKETELKKVNGGENGLEQFSIICRQCGVEFYSMEEFSEHLKKCSMGNDYTKPSPWK